MMSLTRKSIRLEQFFAIYLNFFPRSSYIYGLSMSRVTTRAFKGLRNSCAADAKAKVFIEDRFLSLSREIQFDISRIVVNITFPVPTFRT